MHRRKFGHSVESPEENLEKLPKDRLLLVYCAGGYRSSLAASLLQGSGFDRVSEIAGGIVAWEAANLPVQSASALSQNSG
jgi:hydroxyacylglutathione hydrolase